MLIAVIVPYYQREAGILGRALESVAAQRILAGSRIRVIIVNDSSPNQPGTDLATLILPHWLSVEVVSRPNGGPGKARNTGLENVTNEDYVAFLDSDDVWMPDHLQTAVNALDECNADLYFCDSRVDDTRTQFEEMFFPYFDAEIQPNTSDSTSFIIANDSAVSILGQRYVSHTSTIVFRNNPQLISCRFDEDLRLAGEDHMMWLTLASLARRTCFSTLVGSYRGRGVDAFRSIGYANAELWFKRHCMGVLKYMHILRAFALALDARRIIQDNLRYHSYEAFKAFYRISKLSVVRDPEALRLLWKIFPYPWIHALQHVRRWQLERRSARDMEKTI